MGRNAHATDSNNNLNKNNNGQKENNLKLNELKKGERGEIIRIDADKTLRDRLSSFGIVRGELVTVVEHSLAKQTIEIEIGTSLVVLRANEAEKIEIDKKGENNES